MTAAEQIARILASHRQGTSHTDPDGRDVREEAWRIALPLAERIVRKMTERPAVEIVGVPV